MRPLEAELARLKEELEQLEKALPAHGLKPAHLLRIEELEERIAQLERELAPGGSGAVGGARGEQGS